MKMKTTKMRSSIPLLPEPPALSPSLSSTSIPASTRPHAPPRFPNRQQQHQRRTPPSPRASLHPAHHCHAFRERLLRFVLRGIRILCEGSGGVMGCSRSWPVVVCAWALDVGDCAQDRDSGSAQGEHQHQPCADAQETHPRATSSPRNMQRIYTMSSAASGCPSPLALRTRRAGIRIQCDGGQGRLRVYVEPSHVDATIGEVMLVKKKSGGGAGWGWVRMRMREGRCGSSRLILPQSSIPHARMSTTPASVCTSSSAFTYTSHSNAYLPSSNSSAIATATATQPPTPSKIVPMTTEEDEENMEAGRRLAILQREHAGSVATMVATMISACPHNGTRLRSGTLNLTGGRDARPPEALGSGENVNARGQGQGSIVLRAIKSVRWLARMGSRVQGQRIEEGEREEEKQKRKVGEMGKEKDDARKKDGKKEKAAADGRRECSGDVGSEEMAGGTADEFGFKAKKKPRARPLSGQMLGRSRPKLYEDDEGVLSILDAATIDLARPARLI
ncbi:hypothetical protein CVT25_003915 [Psilocybe cyanescens]|uniref:Uncharacterized protein n=1 Tax=Psilocybe cyanescens TaxID=93625 RepID=A0A409W462_PSICY|nr:hypothetical protein CVT25_003915 [Psilocybe cyanescens]